MGEIHTSLTHSYRVRSLFVSKIIPINQLLYVKITRTECKDLVKTPNFYPIQTAFCQANFIFLCPNQNQSYFPTGFA